MVAVPVLAACTRPVGSATVHDVAWVTTGASVTLPGTDVTPVRLPTRHIQAKVAVGSLPSALAYTAGGRGLLVVTQGDDTLHEIDPATHGVVDSASVGVEPDAVAVAPGGTRGRGIALVANLDSDNVTPVDLGTWRAGPPIPVGTEPVAIAVYTAASGAATAFVADFGSNAVTPIDLSTMQAGAAIPVGPGPQTIAVASTEVLVGNFGNRSLTPINARRRWHRAVPSRCPSTRPASRCCRRVPPPTCAVVRASCRSRPSGWPSAHRSACPASPRGSP